jgi:pantoate--beta-alanine ligase
VRTVRSIAEVRAALGPHEDTIGLVPTMGAFHEGHLGLFRQARAECDVVVASLFVNPAQFGPGEDLHSYPRDEERDAGLAAAEGVDFLFVPTADEMYPPGFQTWVEVAELSHVLEGQYRPGHFRGVATVCLKLFAIVRPQFAYFGQKDAQQIAVLRRLVSDLALELEIRSHPIVREPDGLALSSRNAFLSPGERQAATAIHWALAAGATAHHDGGDAAAAALEVLAAEPLVKLQYMEVARLGTPLVLAAAARVGTTRLIDNVVLEGDP